MAAVMCCPLCDSDDTAILFTSREKAGSRDFHHCRVCDLVFVPERFHLDAAGQKARYLTHNMDQGEARNDNRDHIPPLHRGRASR